MAQRNGTNNGNGEQTNLCRKLDEQSLVNITNPCLSV